MIERSLRELAENASTQLHLWMEAGRIDIDTIRDGGDCCEYLPKLLGFTDLCAFRHHISEDSRRTMEGLIGPHGWTIYQALLIQRGMK